MKFQPTLSAALVAAVSFCAAPRADATPLGFNADPASPGFHRGDANTGYAVWDTFPSFTYGGDAPDLGGGLTSPTLGQSGAFTVNQGGGLYNVFTSVPTPAGQAGDVFFGGGNAVAFSAAGSVSFTIRGVVLQIKRPGSVGTLADASGFSPTLVVNGGTPIAPDANGAVSGSGDTSSDAGVYSVTSWYWNTSLANLPDAGASTFSVNFGRAASQRGVDGIVLDVGNAAAAPEPGAVALLLLAGGALVVGQRRSRARRERLGGAAAQG